MKHRFSSNEKLVKAYVEQTSTYGCSGNLGFDGDILYSYATPIARRLEDGSYLVRNKARFRSETTSRHIGMIETAIDEWIGVLEIPDAHSFETVLPFEWFKQETENQADKACEWIKRARTARTRRKAHITVANLWINNLEALLRKFDRLDIGERIIRKLRVDIERMA